MPRPEMGFVQLNAVLTFGISTASGSTKQASRHRVLFLMLNQQTLRLYQSMQGLGKRYYRATTPSPRLVRALGTLNKRNRQAIVAFAANRLDHGCSYARLGG